MDASADVEIILLEKKREIVPSLPGDMKAKMMGWSELEPTYRKQAETEAKNSPAKGSPPTSDSSYTFLGGSSPPTPADSFLFFFVLFCSFLFFF